jgi:uncharacterized membrane protein (TIGR02234 family)
VTDTPAARRGYVAALLCLVAGGTLELVATARTWGEAAVHDGLVTTTMQVGGRELVPLAPAVGLLALAAVVAVPATRRTGRRLVGAALATAGLVTVVWSTAVVTDLTARIAQFAGASGDVTGVHTAPGWAVLAAAATALIAGTGLAVVVRGSAWPSMGQRYDRRPARASPSGPGDDLSDRRAGREAWDALDRGEDPTS